MTDNTEDHTSTAPASQWTIPLAGIGAICGLFTITSIFSLLQAIDALFRYGLFGAFLSALFAVALWGVPAYFLLRRYGRAALAKLKENPPKFPAPAATGGATPPQAGPAPANGVLLADLRQGVDDILPYIQPHVDKAQLAVETASSHGGKVGVGDGIARLVVMGVGSAMKGKNWAVAALIVRGDAMGCYESSKKTSEHEANAMSASGQVWLTPTWWVPLAEVPDAIEVSTAANHMTGTTTDVANRVEDVFFMHRGRRMVVGRFFGHVRDTATMHQFEVREFVRRAKKRFKASMGDDSGNGTERRPEKGFDL